MKREIPIPADHITPLIRLIRQQRVILDADLAQLYAVETRVRVEAIKRNARRFPKDFLFRLTREQTASLRSQVVILRPVADGTANILRTPSGSTVPLWLPPSSTVLAQSR